MLYSCHLFLGFSCWHWVNIAIAFVDNQVLCLGELWGLWNCCVELICKFQVLVVILWLSISIRIPFFSFWLNDDRRQGWQFKRDCCFIWPNIIRRTCGLFVLNVLLCCFIILVWVLCRFSYGFTTVHKLCQWLTVADSHILIQVLFHNSFTRRRLTCCSIFRIL